MHRIIALVAVAVLLSCAPRRSAPPLPDRRTPRGGDSTRVALLTAPGDAEWNALGDEATALLSQYLRINTTNRRERDRRRAGSPRRCGATASKPGSSSLLRQSQSVRPPAGRRQRTAADSLESHGRSPGVPEYWTVDPFSGVIKDGYVWGRGART